MPKLSSRFKKKRTQFVSEVPSCARLSFEQSDHHDDVMAAMMSKKRGTIMA